MNADALAMHAATTEAASRAFQQRIGATDLELRAALLAIKESLVLVLAVADAVAAALKVPDFHTPLVRLRVQRLITFISHSVVEVEAGSIEGSVS